MKSTIFFITVLITFLNVECPNKEGQNDSPKHSEEWMLGEEMDTATKTYSIEKATTLKVMVENESLCANSGIGIEVAVNGNSAASDVIADMPGEMEVEIPKNSEVTLTTKVETVDPETACIRLGNAKVKVEY